MCNAVIFFKTKPGQTTAVIHVSYGTRLNFSPTPLCPAVTHVDEFSGKIGLCRSLQGTCVINSLHHHYTQCFRTPCCQVITETSTGCTKNKRRLLLKKWLVICVQCKHHRNKNTNSSAVLMLTAILFVLFFATSLKFQKRCQ